MILLCELMAAWISCCLWHVAVAGLGYAGFTAAQLYANVDNVVRNLNSEVHAIAPIAVGTTGAILERRWVRRRC